MKTTVPELGTDMPKSPCVRSASVGGDPIAPKFIATRKLRRDNRIRIQIASRMLFLQQLLFSLSILWLSWSVTVYDIPTQVVRFIANGLITFEVTLTPHFWSVPSVLTDH